MLMVFAGDDDDSNRETRFVLCSHVSSSSIERERERERISSF